MEDLCFLLQQKISYYDLLVRYVELVNNQDLPEEKKEAYKKNGNAVLKDIIEMTGSRDIAGTVDLVAPVPKIQ